MLLLYFSIATGIAHWVSVWFDHRKGILITKPLMMVFLLLWEIIFGKLFSQLGDPSILSMIWFFVGLVFCTIGDMFLMFREKHFLKGLIAFLTGHVFYVVGFGTLIPVDSPAIIALSFAGLILTSGLMIYRRLYQGMRENNRSRMIIPVAFYTIVISAMLYSAIMTAFVWEKTTYVSLLILGALLFYISDVINAWAEFVRPIQKHRFWIMTTYYLAELFIAVGAVYTFLL